MQPQEFKTLRKKLKKTQKQMSQLLGVSLKAIHSYEQGWRAIPGHVERQLFYLLDRKSRGKKGQTPCWNILNCPEEKRQQCPAWEFSSGDLCWFINGTICHGTIFKTWKEKFALCRTCDVFNQMVKRVEKNLT